MLANFKSAWKDLWPQWLLIIAATIGVMWATTDAKAMVLSYATSILGGLIAGNLLVTTDLRRMEAERAVVSHILKEGLEGLEETKRKMDEDRAAWQEGRPSEEE